ncbi:(2Fe-2S) ferredoxin domain-containing protein [Thiobaca trueperi]|uniref:(2Fe-2S) ferredoxin n=1 Tax=Thiobaca trueperi TaxID=127458 RepID=A0A4R3MR93_9GAMM|nr:(2Fe-2S) ferredoxin domain-containing protein [Thiobaca trueperi]TCT18744.1 (2Fe-2S) ferredoxin [Thiobaca trueperi]
MSYYRCHVFFCTNQREDGRLCCGQAEAAAGRDYLKRRVKESGLAGIGGVRVNTAGCMDRCGEGPVIAVYPDAIWYTYEGTDDLEDILQEHLLHGRPVERLKLPG